MTARSLDGSRLISAAMEVRGDKQNPDLGIVDDPFCEFTDLVSFNQYIGWCDGLPDKTADDERATPRMVAFKLPGVGVR